MRKLSTSRFSPQVRKSDLARSLAGIWLTGVIAAAILLVPVSGAFLPVSPDPGIAGAQTIVRISTTPPGRLQHTYGTGIAEILSKYSKLSPRILPVGGGLSWAPMMDRKEMEFATTNTFEAYRVYHGIDEYHGPSGGKGFDIRYAFSAAPFSTGLIVRKDSGIHKVGDLKGKPIPVGYTAAPFFDFFTRAILANAGLTYKDIVPVPVAEIARARDLFTQGRVVTPGTWAPGIAQVLEMDAALGIRFLSLDPSPEAVKRMVQVTPGAYVIPPGAYAGKTGVGPDTQFYALDNGLAAHPGIPDQVVYEAVKALWEQNDELRKFHPVLEDWKRERFVSERVPVPYHPGAIRLFQEKGVWTPAMAELNERLKKK